MRIPALLAWLAMLSLSLTATNRELHLARCEVSFLKAEHRGLSSLDQSQMRRRGERSCGRRYDHT